MNNPKKIKKKRCFKLRFLRFSKRSTLLMLRILLLFVMALLIVFLGGWIFLVKTFNAQRISEAITSELQKHLSRPVAISSMELTFVNTIELKGFYVLDTVGNPGSALLSADTVTLRFKLLPLLAHQLVIDEVVFQTPRFNVARLPDGSNNVPQIKHTGKTVYTGKESGQKWIVSVEDWTIKNGVLSYQDLASGVTHALYGFNLHLEQLRFNEPTQFALDMVLRNQWQNGISDMEIEGTGQVDFADFNWEQFALRNLNAKVFLFQNPIELTANVVNLRNPQFNIQAKIPAFTEQDLSVFNLDDTPFSVPKSSVMLQGTLEQNYKQLKLSQVTASAADVKLGGKGQFDLSESPFSADLQFSTGTFNLADKHTYYAPLAKYKLKGKGSAQGRIARQNGKYTLPLLTLRAQEASGSFYGFETENVTGEFQAKNNFSDLYTAADKGKVTVANSIFDNVNLSATWRKGDLYAYIAAAELNGVPVKINTTITNLKSDKRKIRSN